MDKENKFFKMPEQEEEPEELEVEEKKDATSNGSNGRGESKFTHTSSYSLNQEDV